MKGNLPAAENFELLFRFRKVSLYQPPLGFRFAGILKYVFGHLWKAHVCRRSALISGF
jgi:hypothetical protein